MPGNNEGDKKDPTEDGGRKMSRKTMYISLGVAAVLIIILAIGLGVGLKKDDPVEENVDRGVLPTEPPVSTTSSPTPSPVPSPTPFPTPLATVPPTAVASEEVFPACSICGEGQVVGNPDGIIEVEGESINCGSFADFCLEGGCNLDVCAAFSNVEVVETLFGDCDCQPEGVTTPVPTPLPTAPPTPFPTAAPTSASSEGTFEPCSICVEGVLGNPSGTVTLNDQTVACGDLDDFCLGGSCSPEQCAVFSEASIQALIADCQCSTGGTFEPTETSVPDTAQPTETSAPGAS